MRVLVVNGPNLNMLGRREPEIYGSQTLADVEGRLGDLGATLGIDIETFQSNHEGEIVDVIQGTDAHGLVINPGALGHTSRAIADTLRSIEAPAVEVHVSNVKRREPWRAQSVIGEACVATIYGRGIEGYVDAVRHLANRAAMAFEIVRYGPHPDSVGELRHGRDGLVVLVHGGVWRQQYRRDTIESLAVDLARRGYHTWNIGYRLFGTGGGWPGSAHDVLTAFDFTPQLDLGGPLVVMGHSAGGYLALWAAPRAQPQILLCVGLAPVVDLDDAVASGGVLAPEASQLKEAGAPGQVDPRGVPAVLVHGETDDVVPLRHSTGLAARTGAELHRIPGGHFELLDPGKPHWEWVLERLP